MLHIHNYRGSQIHESFIQNNYEITCDENDLLYVKKIIGNFTFVIHGAFYNVELYKVFDICCEYKLGGTVSVDVYRFVRNLPLLLEKIERIAKLSYDDIYFELISLT